MVSYISTDIIGLAHRCFGFMLRSWLCFILPLPPTVWCCSVSDTSLRYRGWAPDSTGSFGYHALSSLAEPGLGAPL